MKTLATIAAILLLSSCAGPVYKTVKYGISSQHAVEGTCLAGIAQGDGKYEIVIAKKGDAMQAWVERDGKIVESQFMARRAFVQPHWPFKNSKAIRSGTPKELGLLDEVGKKRDKRWLLHIEERHRVVTNYRAASALYGEENVTIEEHPTVMTNGKYWIAIKHDGRTWYDPCKGTFLEHYQSYQPNSRDGKWTVQWRGSYDEYRKLADKDQRTPEEIEANRKESLKHLASLGYWYWNMSPAKRYGVVPLNKKQ